MQTAIMTASRNARTVPEQCDAQDVLAVLSECSLIVGAFRRRLRDAGYPFREPEHCSAFLARINGLVECLDADKARPQRNRINAALGA